MMSQPARRKCESGIYHVVTRGVGRQIIFEHDEDMAMFYNLLLLGSEKFAIEVYAWCLMENHIHLLLKGEMDAISAFMRYVLSTYAVGFNARHGRIGHLFENRFKSEPIETDGHLLAAVRYIHQNPLKAGMATTETYRWSSYREYVEGIPPIGTQVLISSAFVLGLFASKRGFVAFHAKESDSSFLEPEDSKYTSGDKRALRIALEVVGENGLFSVKSLPKEERDRVLSQLKARGLTLRQIERYTGVSKSQISRVLNSNGTNIL